MSRCQGNFFSSLFFVLCSLKSDFQKFFQELKNKEPFFKKFFSRTKNKEPFFKKFFPRTKNKELFSQKFLKEHILRTKNRKNSQHCMQCSFICFFFLPSKNIIFLTKNDDEKHSIESPC